MRYCISGVASVARVGDEIKNKFLLRCKVRVYTGCKTPKAHHPSDASTPASPRPNLSDTQPCQGLCRPPAAAADSLIGKGVFATVRLELGTDDGAKRAVKVYQHRVGAAGSGQ